MDEINLVDVRLGDIAGFCEALNALTKSINDHDQADKRSISVTLNCETEANKVVIIDAVCAVKLSMTEKFGSKIPMKSRLSGTDLLLVGEQGDLFDDEVAEAKRRLEQTLKDNGATAKWSSIGDVTTGVGNAGQ